MGATLRVDPAQLRAAARAQADVGTFASGMATGQSLTSAAAGGAGPGKQFGGIRCSRPSSALRSIRAQC
jgi:hypothetical protein